jgi:hypothetical protein
VPGYHTIAVDAWPEDMLCQQIATLLQILFDGNIDPEPCAGCAEMLNVNGEQHPAMRCVYP